MSTPEEAARKLRRMLKDLPRKAAQAALLAEASRILKIAIRQVPKDTGDLRDSNYMKRGGRGRGVSVEVGFGGIAAPYALAVHEMGVSGKTAGKNIAWTTAGTGARYLTNAVDQRRSKMAKDMADDISKYIKGLG